MGARAARGRRSGFTLIELLIVISIILLVSAATLPAVVSAYNHRQVSEAARIIQAALVGARDAATKNGAPAGLRFLPDPALNVFDGTTLRMDPTKILAADRFVPIQLAPDYTEGRIRMIASGSTLNYDTSAINPYTYFIYPPSKSPTGVTTYYPALSNRLLYVEQEVFDKDGLLNPPTSWYWNVRIGDKIQINNTGVFYTVVGPMQVNNPELFVNVGVPGTVPPMKAVTSAQVSGNHYPEFLFLVNGVDDDRDGFVDNGWDGVDNDLDGVTDRAPVISSAGVVSSYWEWTETETWQSSSTSYLTQGQLPYTLVRRPVIAPGARETGLPSNVVVDLTTWNAAVPERSRVPLDATNGTFDILITPDGSVVPTTTYSSPTSFGMGASFFHLWLAERGDLYDPITPTSPAVNYLPQVANANTPAGETRFLKGDRMLLTLFTRSGQLVTNPIESFDAHNVNLPFVLPQQGIRGDNR
ncbi:hypothetical protein OJF2_67630 [Aquisphaera giovannonii]|uniref:Uncharacterized protein n=1 Tax=Aquisphaera giovannonii TaxID=406548 RepID=A0A5B9WDL4_9BACT|nr:prepilin-type N-terminal cleavage/methylation domain-containing protein [Aquisphaera giovannonii]QEH38165.1 hypothetical protein OJF2_67630 [Aquisphaera giovannonii]